MTRKSTIVVGLFFLSIVAIAVAQTENDSVQIVERIVYQCPPNATNGTGSDAFVTMHIADWYPKGSHYVFHCNATGFSPIKYSWFYGDGEKLIEIPNQNTYHIFKNPGTYTVKCIAHGDGISREGSMTVTVANATGPSVPTNQSQNQTNASDKVSLCHKTGSDTNQYNELTISRNALNAHLNHGDIYPVPVSGCPMVNSTNVTNQSNQTPINQTPINQTPTNQTGNETNEINVTTSTFAALLNGLDEVPPTNTTATGSVNATLVGNTLTVNGTFQDLNSELMSVSGSPAHIHLGIPGENGAIVFALSVDAVGNNGTLFGTFTLTDQQVQDLLDEDYYVNVHTEDFSSGEIRGQLLIS